MGHEGVFKRIVLCIEFIRVQESTVRVKIESERGTGEIESEVQYKWPSSKVVEI